MFLLTRFSLVQPTFVSYATKNNNLGNINSSALPFPGKVYTSYIPHNEDGWRSPAKNAEANGTDGAATEQC